MFPSEPAATPSKLLSCLEGDSVITPAIVIRPIRSPPANHRYLSGPDVIAHGPLLAKGRVNSVMAPVGVIRPTFMRSASVNQRFPSGPEVIAHGPLWNVGMANSALSTPAVLMCRTLFPPCSANQRFPSGPLPIPMGYRAAGRENSTMVPVGLILPILLPAYSVNQRFPSGPIVIPHG